MLKKIGLIFILVMNIISFNAVRVDKNLAVNGAYGSPEKNANRMSEVKIVALSSFGAVPGTMLGFKIFHHKTNQNIKGYLWDALWTVFIENILLYILILWPRRGKTTEFRRNTYGKRQFRIKSSGK